MTRVRRTPGGRVRELPKGYGRTYPREAGIRLAGQPSALSRLLVLATLAHNPSWRKSAAES